MLEVRPTTNLDDLKAVLSHPEIWGCISSDGSGSADEFDWSKLQDSNLVVCGYVDSKPIAIMLFHWWLDGEMLHIHVLPEYRKEYAEQFGAKALLFGGDKLYAEIPDMYQNVVRFAQKFGFSPISSREPAATKGGQKYTTTLFARSL